MKRAERDRLGALPEGEIRDLGLAQEEFERRCRESDRLREDHWTRQVLELDTWPCLFVYGGRHTAEFTRRLRSESIDVLVLPEWEYETETFRDYSSKQPAT